MSPKSSAVPAKLNQCTALTATIAAFLKIMHPGGEPSTEEFEEYTQYAVEARRRVKEQMNKRKPDDEFAQMALHIIDNGYLNGETIRLDGGQTGDGRPIFQMGSAAGGYGHAFLGELGSGEPWAISY